MANKRDIKLKEEILQRTDETFELLYSKYSKLVLYFGCTMTGNRRDAEDLVQEVFMKIYANIEDFNPYMSSFKTWLVKITRNHIIDFMKHKKEIIYDNELIDNLIDQNIFTERMEYSIRTLNHQERDILILKAIFNFTHKEIADSLNITTDVCKKTYATAKDKSRKEWLDYEN